MARSTRRINEVTEIPPTMTREEVMSALHISRSTFNRMVAEGELTAYWIGSHRKQVIDKRSVLQYFQEPANAVAISQRAGITHALAQ
ncbi:helix-turn-helix domain-containing protein [Bifidobacterium oedipodis]|uniref:Helix-turn-helix domain-containing protein n=1 Tax=Bifidobacterium oedipodis TaxID=2675322 RepID=A0A7Y0ENA9_9BIFI|nr:helix-turn-helix domain-containing protein [Bifidobacterium sp. DSM 109957]NMM93425.1 hypothetical protein [Bifidobacterium sp. DSM 109957]